MISYRVSRKLGRHTYPASSRCGAAKISARTHAPISIGVIGSAIECVPNGRFAKENEINKESAWYKDRVSIIPRAKVKELPFTFAEDLKGGRTSGGTKESGDLRQREEGERQGEKRKEKKEKGVVGVDRYLRIADLRNNNDPSAGGG